MYLFRKQIKIETFEPPKLLIVCYFIVLCYIEAWFNAPFAPSAPRSDLQLVSRLEEFSRIHLDAATAAKNKFAGHLWYLSAESLGLAVFDEGLPDDEREALVHSILTKIGDEDPLKRLRVPLDSLLGKPLHELASVDTQEFFKILGIDTRFFDLPVSMWSSDESYKRGKQVRILCFS